ncbi:hypothetical protein M23134_00437 [Microscilla marina ATCC 23134]|uniref:Uncharacterized protein n=1 Tax=Microscilla marina ATCC 23134 TaxID=313606 RepID=A1ZJ17_MICM2|nr:hypothetical protein M23134_00437 [Microscilla marina ATCC 23134]
MVIFIPIVVIFSRSRKQNKKIAEQTAHGLQQGENAHHKPLYEPSKSTPQVSDKAVIEVAVANNGKVTSTVLCAKLDISVADATAKLESLHNQGIFTLDNTDSGHLVYVLVDLDLMK